ncbi:hypothetical protein [Pedobacter agri]|uniref:CSD domain-containing protein n=1 Tax=Pedobacter agri TaxID=454586 RepID=A0A9X3DEW2_9SPHI|nr:hypothetical protein [Pedobacter agri]MCX3264870.1 hypothetical protein [Pedobacter agri]
MRKGIVLSYNKVVKYGFIKDLNGQKIRFYNEDGLIILNVGDLVQFAIGIIKNRPCAVKIIILCRNQSKVDQKN